jgi:hypothetical protein
LTHAGEPLQVTRRWFADTSASYALAAIALLEYARDHRGEFVFGPLDAESMRNGGLEVSGPPGLLDEVAKMLSGVPGLAEPAAPGGREEPLARLALRDLDGARGRG